MLTMRLSADEKAMLDALVRKRAERLADEGGAVSASSVIRGLIRQAAAAEEDVEPARLRKPKP